jgi:hypothetical protein
MTAENEATQEPTRSKRAGRNGNVAPPAPKGNKYALKHGLHSYKAMLNGNGLDERRYSGHCEKKRRS